MGIIIVSMQDQNGQSNNHIRVGCFVISYELKHYRVVEADNRKLFFSTAPVIRCDEGNYINVDASTSDSLINLLPKLQNEVLGFELTISNEGFSIVLSSVKMSRARWYYTFQDKRLFISDNLLELLPLIKDKKANTSYLYGILKYGEGPEIFTSVQNIYSVPPSSYVSICQKAMFAFNNGRVGPLKHNIYFSLAYPQTGGDLNNTDRILRKATAASISKDFAILISGGIDSTILNQFVSLQTDSTYPGIYIHFEENSSELIYAKQSIKGTKAELHVLEIGRKDFNSSFEDSIGKLFQPVYDDGSALVGACLSQYLNGLKLNNIIDGTVADSCYGVRNYHVPLIAGKSRSFFSMYLNETITCALRLRNNKLGDKLFPRDRFNPDINFEELKSYLGPFVNVYFAEAEAYTSALMPYYYYYYSLVDSVYLKDEWVPYTVNKMLLYAARQTSVKVYDMFYPCEVSYPFMFKDVLIDQGKYTWAEKSHSGIVKYPLKKILERYIDSSFIYRNKVGLNSPTLNWMMHKESLDYLLQLFSEKGGIAEYFIGNKKIKKVIKVAKSGHIHVNLKRLILYLAVQQAWLKKNHVSLS